MDSALYQTGHPKIRVWGTVFPLTLQSAEQDCDDIAFAAQSPLARLTRIYRWSSLPRAEQAEILLIASAHPGLAERCWGGTTRSVWSILKAQQLQIHSFALQTYAC